MTTILYPTRGGESAYLNQDWAVGLAKEREADLLLLYVSNVHFLDHTAAPIRLDLIEAELEDLGEFLLVMALERVEKLGFTADMAIRSGEFLTALEEVIEERGVSAVVLGLPADETGITSEEYISGVARKLQDRCCIEVFVVGGGNVVLHLPPIAKAAPENGE